MTMLMPCIYSNMREEEIYINQGHTKFVKRRNIDILKESFSKEEGKKYVTPDEIIERLYAAIFVNQYSAGTYRIKMGEYEFTKESRNFALRASGMMSPYADL